MFRLSVLLSGALAIAGCGVRPAYLPAPSRAFAQFRALPQPQPELAVGALWIEGHGAYGAGAAPDNLETIKSLAALTLDGTFQVSLNLGVLQFLDLDPSLRSKINARLNDVSIVRVKDLGKLDGPAEQDRIYQGLKAGSITVTATREVGLDIEASANQRQLPVVGRGTTGQMTTLTIEAREAFFAILIARMTEVDGTAVMLRPPRIATLLGSIQLRLELVDPADCAKGAHFSVGKNDKSESPLVTSKAPRIVTLAVPVYRDNTLYDRLRLSQDEGACRFHAVPIGRRLKYR